MGESPGWAQLQRRLGFPPRCCRVSVLLLRYDYGGLVESAVKERESSGENCDRSS